MTRKQQRQGQRPFNHGRPRKRQAQLQRQGQRLDHGSHGTHGELQEQFQWLLDRKNEINRGGPYSPGREEQESSVGFHPWPSVAFRGSIAVEVEVEVAVPSVAS